MKRILKKALFLLLAVALPLTPALAREENPQAVTDLLQRVTNAADKFVTVLDEDLATANEGEVFVITSQGGKPCIQGSTLSALTTGINWYLNHYAHVNLTWNRLTTDLSGATLPVPSAEERHTTRAAMRYYLNYCTFSYSMSVWTWERWQQEIDWMALHGINMPLQIVGLDALWYNLLTEDLGYTAAEAGKFIAGPCFQAWWGMNNLEGWGGPNPQWWYERQSTLARKMLARMRELGMQPVLPGYAGMVPSDIGTKGYTAINQGGWCAFTRPYILDPNSAAFATVSEKYYKQLEKLMGTSEYYSMDPFHEGANTSGIDVPSAYKALGNAMLKANPEGKWVIQFWQWSGAQYNVLDQVAKGKLIVLDLFSDAHTHFGAYKGHDAIYCSLANFGGRTGLFGRFNGVIDGYFNNKAQFSNIKGIGATPEAIEQVPVLYDILFELPWHATKPDAAAWMKDYATARYGQQSDAAQQAWEILRNTALDCKTGLQGPHEAIVCSRPAFEVNKVSSWGGAAIFYDTQEMYRAAHLLLSAKDALSGENYSYDLVDVTRQALTDYSQSLLRTVKAANDKGNKALLRERSNQFLQLILDLDELLGTNKDFRLGRWTQLARGIADEAAGTTTADREWLESDNARTLITTWGPRNSAEGGGLRDYSYREWNGMMRDFYYPRWKAFFDEKIDGTPHSAWFDMEYAWAHNATKQYTMEAEGNTAEVAARLLAKYFLPMEQDGAAAYYVQRGTAEDARTKVEVNALRGKTFACPIPELTADVTATLGVDLNGDGVIDAATETANGTDIAVPADAAIGKVRALLTLSDGTEFAFTVVIREEITEPRTVTVSTAGAEQGTAVIEGTTETSVTNDQPVSIKATAVSGYDFYNWTNAEGQVVSTDNPYIYYGKDAASFTANFIVNKWGAPKEDKGDYNDIKSYEQYVTRLTAQTEGADPAELYTATQCPENLFHTTQIYTAAAGNTFTLKWTDTDGKNGLSYCRLSAYIDLNSDGDFDDEGEFLAVIGNKASSGNSAVSDGSLAITLPFGMPLGITHIRLRFDGAWSTGWDATTDAMPAKATTKRMVYDIPLNIAEYAPYATTVTVRTADVKQGTVDANGQPDTYTYKVGEDIVLRCYPAEGYKIQSWTDQNGRELPAEWMEGNNIRFKPFGKATITANFVPETPLTYGDWTFDFEERAAGLVITGVQKGSGELDLTQDNSLGKRLAAINPDVLQGNTALTALRLPADPEVSLDNFLNTSLSGAGVQNATIQPTQTLTSATPWTLTLQVENDGSTFNQWGSGLFATGTDALGGSYPGGFQLYLNKAGEIIVKCGGAGENKFSINAGSTFTVTITYDGQDKETFTLINAEGKTETKALNVKLNDISTFACAIPAGVNIAHAFINDPTLHSNPLQGCTALTNIFINGGAASFSSVDGILYNAAGDALRAYPEGRLFTHPFRLTSADGCISAAPLADTDGNMTAANSSDRRVKVTAAGETTMPASLWQFVAIEGGVKVMNLNAGRFFGGYSASSNGRIELPTSATQWHGTYIYKGSTSGKDYTLTLDCGDYHVTNAEGLLSLSKDATPTVWTVEELNELTVTLPAEGYTTLCLPFAVALPQGLTASYATGNDGNVLALEEVEGVIPANFPVILQGEPGEHTLTVCIEVPTAQADNILTGTLLERSGLTTGSFYALGTDNALTAFYLSAAENAPANSAFLPKSRVSGDLTALYLSKADGINGINSGGQDANHRIYDLSGRRVLTPARGIYVNGKGTKVLVK